MSFGSEKIAQADWIRVATDRISQIVLQNGVENVNRTFAANSIPLQNYIGFVLGIPFNAIKPNADLSFSQNNQLINGSLSFYTGSALERVQNFVNAMYDKSPKSLNIFLIIVPILHYNEDTRELNSLFILRFKVGMRTEEYFIDVMGRTYRTFDRFLARNNFSNGFICYPHDGIFEIDREDKVICGVSKCGSVMRSIDLGIGILGIASGVGAMIATGGMALPLVCASVGSAVYGTGRSIATLIDRDIHRQSINPFENREARVVWLGMAANIVSFSAIGARYALVRQVTNGVSLETRTSALTISVNVLQLASSTISGFAAIDQIIYLIEKWGTLPADEKIMLAASICFHFRCIISYQNANQIIGEAKKSAIMTVLGGSNFSENGSMESALSSLISNPIGFKLAREAFERCIEIRTDVENHTLIIFGKFTFKIRNFLGFEEKDVTNLFDMLSSIVNGCASTFMLLSQFYANDVQFVRLIASDKQSTGNSWFQTLRLLEQVTDIFKSIGNLCVQLHASRIRIGRGIYLSVSQMFDIFSICGMNGTKNLCKSFIDLAVDSCSIFNRIVEQHGVKDLANCIKSLDFVEMKDAIEGLIHGKENCGLFDEVRFIEFLKNGVILLESRAEIEMTVLKRFDKFKLRKFVQPFFIRTTTNICPENREMIKNIWINSFLDDENEYLPLILQKVEHLMTALSESQKDDAITVTNSLKFAFTMMAKNITEFYYFVLFATAQVEVRTKLGVPVDVVNNEVFSNMEVLIECYKSLERRVSLMQLNGYTKIVSTLANEITSVVLQEHGRNGALKFGHLGNAIVHAAQQPELTQKGGLMMVNRYFSQIRDDNGRFSSIDGIKTAYIKDQNDVQFMIVISGSGHAYIDTVHPIMDDLMFSFLLEDQK